MAKYDNLIDLSLLERFFANLKSLLLTRSVHYGVSSTAAATAGKAVTISGVSELREGLGVRVKFANAQTHSGNPTLNVNSLGAKAIYRIDGTAAQQYEWQAGEVLDLVYDGAKWIISGGGRATTDYYGKTRLMTSATSTYVAMALTPASLNSLVRYTIANYPPYSAAETYAVGDRVRHGYQIWECVTAISTAEAWTEAHWKALPTILSMIEALQQFARLQILKQPESLTVTRNTSFTMSIVANTTDVTYQWQYYYNSKWNDFQGGNAATLTKTATSSWNGWKIRCIVTGEDGTVLTSDEATLTVT